MDAAATAGHGRAAVTDHAPKPPFPDSLCHRCAAPPRYVRTTQSVFILCPLLPSKYPPQPVVRCALFTPRPASPP